MNWLKTLRRNLFFLVLAVGLVFVFLTLNEEEPLADVVIESPLLENSAIELHAEELTKAVQNEAGEPIGWATSWSGDVWVAPDHLLSEHRSLWRGGEEFEVLVRDFRHDVVFLRVLEEAVVVDSVWAQAPPILGSELFWHRHGVTQTGRVTKLGATFQATDRIVNLVELTGVLRPGDSGRPVFDSRGVLQGILVATDLELGRSYMVRGDVVGDLAEAFLEG